MEPNKGRLTLNRDAIKQANDVASQLSWIETPEWADGNPSAGVWVRPLTGRERADWQEKTFVQTKRGVQQLNYHTFTVGLVILGTCDEAGHPIFDRRDQGWLLEKSAGLLERVADAILALSGLNDQDLEDVKKGLRTTTIDADYSVSPSHSDAPWESSSTASAHGNSPSGPPSNWSKDPSAIAEPISELA